MQMLQSAMMPSLSSSFGFGMPSAMGMPTLSPFMADTPTFSEEALQPPGMMAAEAVMLGLEIGLMMSRMLGHHGSFGTPHNAFPSSSGFGMPSNTGTTMPGPAPGSGQSLGWAKQYLGTNQYSDLCGSFVYDAYTKGAGMKLGPEWNANTASQIGHNLQASGKLHPYNPNSPPPPGACIFYSADSNNGSDGHVCLVSGSNQVLSSGWPGSPVKYWNVGDLNKAEGEQPMGWYMPPA